MCERRAVGRRSFGLSGFRVFAGVSDFPGEAKASRRVPRNPERGAAARKLKRNPEIGGEAAGRKPEMPWGKGRGLGRAGGGCAPECFAVWARGVAGVREAGRWMPGVAEGGCRRGGPNYAQARKGPAAQVGTRGREGAAGERRGRVGARLAPRRRVPEFRDVGVSGFRLKESGRPAVAGRPVCGADASWMRPYRRTRPEGRVPGAG